MNASTFSLPLADGGIQMLQLSVEICSARAVDGNGPFRFVEYITRAKCASAINTQLIPLLVDAPDLDSLFMQGRRYAIAAGDLTDEAIFEPHEQLHVSLVLGQDNNHKYQYTAVSIPVRHHVDAPVGAAAVAAAADVVQGRGRAAAVEEETSSEESDAYSIDSDLSADAEYVETQIGFDDLLALYDPNLEDEEEIVETQLM